MAAESGPWGLQWIIDEVAATLEEATGALAAYLATPTDRQQLQFCRAHLHQVAGSLQVANSAGGILLIEAMQNVVDALSADALPNAEQVDEVLAAAAAALPGYLDHCLTARSEQPELLLTYLNDLRALGRQPLATEGGLFAADLSAFDTAPLALPSTQDRDALGALCRKLRQIYQHALLALLKGEQTHRQRELMLKVAQRMGELFADSQRGQLWNLCHHTLAQLGHPTSVGPALRQLFWELDRDLRACEQIGQQAQVQPQVSRALFKNLLYYAAAGESENGRALRHTFALARELFSDQLDRLWPAQGSAVRATLRRELTEDLHALRQLSEDRAATGERLEAAAAALRPPLRRLRDTLTVAEVPGAAVAAERAAALLAADAVAASGWAQWADAIEALECLVDNWATAGADSTVPEARAAAVESATTAVIDTVRSLIDDIKEAVIGYAAEPEDRTLLATAVHRAREISPALRMIGEDRLSAALVNCGDHLDRLRLSSDKSASARLDTLADCLIAADSYLDLRVQGDLQTGERVLLQAEQRAARLRTEAEALAAAPVLSPPHPEHPRGMGEGDAVLGPYDEVDREIREIFVEEAREVLAFLDSQQLGTAAAGPPAALGEIRRGFHTLKGSGRMVGAAAIGEVSWAIEQLLNRIIDGDREWTLQVTALVADAGSRLSALVEAFASGVRMDPGPEDRMLIDRATNLNTGEPVRPAPSTQELTESLEPLTAEFHDEAKAQIGILEEFLAAPLEATSSSQAEQVARAIHTLIGCCERLGYPPLSRALRRLELVTNRYATRGESPHPDALLAATTIIQCCRELISGKATAVDLDAISNQLDLGRDTADAAMTPAAERLATFMTRDLNTLLAVSAWQSEAPQDQWIDQLPALQEELAKLAEVALAAGQAALGSTAHLLAENINYALAVDTAAPPPDRDTITRGIEQLLAMLDAVAAALPPPPLDSRLEAQLRHTQQPVGAAADATPPAAPQPDTPEVPYPPAAGEAPDPELVTIFLEEAAELSEQIEQALYRWRAEQSPTQQIENLKRALHTLKGSARMAGCTALGSLCHDFETLLLEQTSQTTEPQFLDTYLAYYDQIEQLREQVGSEGQKLSEGAPEVRQPQPSGPPPVIEEAQQPATAATESDSAPQLPTPVLLQRSGITPPWRRHEPASGARLSGGVNQLREVVKIPAAVLDKLVNLADETGISRSRIEQQLQQFHFQLEEMETTVDRFHDQVRRLGMETEAQILFRREQLISEGVTDQFDPLEMDRYSTLQQLSRALEESASDLHDLKDTLLTKARETEALLIQQARVNRELQENLSLTRMVPFSRVVPRLRRIVRQTASELGKPVELALHNIEGEMDRSVLERIVPSLEHLIRNAIDHGIEPPERRSAVGKPATGRVAITFSREAGDVVIQLADDGCGLDLGAIRTKAETLGLLPPGAPIGEQDLTQLIFHPGFSTSRSVSQISGRGIGMDVVDSELRQLGGSVTPLSRTGQGTEFTLRLPFTVSVNRALLLKAGRERYGTLVNNVSGVVRLDAEDVAKLTTTDEGYAYRGERYRICPLGDLIGSLEPRAELTPGKSALVLTKGTTEATAVLVDALEPSQEIVVKSLGPQFAKVRGLSGATVLGDGQVVPILDLNALIADRVAPWSALRQSAPVPLPATPHEASGPTLLVVDDSVTMRKATGRLLERQGYKVLSARDGVEAMQLLQEILPDLILLDVEMPRMDGFEVTRQIRASARLQALPIIMITSRSGEKHRNKALELGVNHYLGKPYQEEQLLTVIATCLPSTEVEQHESGRGF